MRHKTYVILVCALALGLPRWCRSDDQSEAKSIIDKAIKAAGGEEKLKKYPASTFKVKGIYRGMGTEIPYTGEYAVQFPKGQMRVSIQAQDFKFVIVVNKDKGWRKMGDDVQELDKDQLKEQKEQIYANDVIGLAPLKGKGFKFEPLGEIKLDGKTAIGVKVSHKGHRDVSLYFDPKTYLLVKSEHRIVDDMTMKEANEEAFYKNYKEIEGLQVPMKIEIKRDGSPYVDGESDDVKPLEKLDDSTFEKP